MKKININRSDAEDCIAYFRKLSSDFNEDAAYIKRLAASGGLPSEKADELRRIMVSEAETARSNADYLVKVLEETEKTEEKILLMVRKSVFEQNSRIIVEKSAKPARGNLVSGHTFKHDSRLTELALKSRAGDMK